MKITQAMFFVYAVVYAIFTLVHSSVREPTMALKTDREIASLKAEEGQRLVVAVGSGECVCFLLVVVWYVCS